MRILCTNHSLISRGGSESYLETVAPALRALGHEVEFFSSHVGPFADTLRTRGFVVHDDPTALVDRYDVIHAQHATAALMVRSVLADTPMLFTSHSWFLEIEDPPQDIGIGALVALNDTVADRLRASTLGGQVPVHRLTQPLPISGYESKRVPIRTKPQRAVVVSRRLRRRMGALEEACAANGIELVRVGGDTDLDPGPEIMRADIVFGAGRSALEGMALARAAFVFEEAGAGGWVTEASYESLEANGFTPSGDIAVDELTEALAAYDPEFGSVARELIIRNHDANKHAARLVEISRGVTAPNGPLPSVEDLTHRSVLNERLFELELRARDAEWESVRRGHEANALRRELEATRNTLSWRLTAPLRRLRRHR